MKNQSLRTWYLTPIVLFVCLTMTVVANRPAPPTLADSTIELLQKLHRNGADRDTVRKILDLPDSESVPALLDALQARSFAKDDVGREVVFEILGQRGLTACQDCPSTNPPGLIGETLHGAKVFANPVQIGMFVTGMQDPAPAVRKYCATALGRITPSSRESSRVALGNALEDPDPSVVASGIRSLGMWGTNATVEADRLLGMLVPTAELRKRWERIQAEKRKEGAHIQDCELQFRAEAAIARVRILGLACDLELYPTLDVGGRRAGALALAPFVPYIQAPPPASADSDKNEGLWKRVFSFLSSVCQDQAHPDEFRADVLRSLSLPLANGKVDEATKAGLVGLINDAAKQKGDVLPALSKELRAKYKL